MKSFSLTNEGGSPFFTLLSLLIQHRLDTSNLATQLLGDGLIVLTKL